MEKGRVGVLGICNRSLLSSGFLQPGVRILCPKNSDRIGCDRRKQEPAPRRGRTANDLTAARSRAPHPELCSPVRTMTMCEKYYDVTKPHSATRVKPVDTEPIAERTSPSKREAPAQEARIGGGRDGRPVHLVFDQPACRGVAHQDVALAVAVVVVVAHHVQFGSRMVGAQAALVTAKPFIWCIRRPPLASERNRMSLLPSPL